MPKKELLQNSRELPCGRPKEITPKSPSPRQLQQWKDQLREYLVSQGLKFTEQRWKIAEIILLSGGHLDAQDLLEQVKKRHAGIGAATVYRSIKVLCEADILRESLIDANGRVVFELSGGHHHDHIVCTDCGEIFEFSDSKIETLQSAVVEKLSFEEVKHRHVIYAKCVYSRGSK